MIKPYTINEYRDEVFSDAVEFLANWDSDSFCSSLCNMMKSESVTGLEAYGKLPYDIAMIKTARLSWDIGFKEDFNRKFGRMPNSDSPVFFDVDIRMYCLDICRNDLEKIYNELKEV